MPTSKHSHRPALAYELPSKKRTNHVFWADAVKDIQQVDNTNISKQPRVFQHGYGWGGRSPSSEILSANEDSNNMLDRYRDCFSVGGYLNLRDNCVGQYEANCYLNHGSSDNDSVMGLRENKLATPSYFTEYMPYLFSESIGGDIQGYTTENCNNIPANSRPYVATALDSPKMLLDSIPFPIFADGLACDFGTPIFQNIPDDFQLIVAEGGTTADLMAEVNSESPFTGNSGILGQESSPPGPSAEQENLKMLEEGIKPTASRTQGQHRGKVEQIDEPWRDRNHVDEVVHGIGKLEVRLQRWNKQQMDDVQETSYTTRGSASRKRGRP